MKDFIEPESISARTRTWSTKQSTNGWIMVELSIVLTPGWVRCPPTVRPSFRSLKNALIYTLSQSGRVFHGCNKSQSAGEQSFAVACILEQNDRVDHMYSRNQTSLAVEMEHVQNYPHVSNGPLESLLFRRDSNNYSKSCFRWGYADEWETASACTEGSSAAVEQPSARNRWVNSTISSRVGVGLCSSIFNFNVVGRPFENCLVNNAVLASCKRDGSAFDKKFSSSHFIHRGIFFRSQLSLFKLGEEAYL